MRRGYPTAATDSDHGKLSGQAGRRLTTARSVGWRRRRAGPGPAADPQPLTLPVAPLLSNESSAARAAPGSVRPMAGPVLRAVVAQNGGHFSEEHYLFRNILFIK